MFAVDHLELEHSPIGEFDSVLDTIGVAPPHLEAVVHPAGDNLGAVHVEVGAEDLVPVPLHPSEDGNIVLRLHVPQPQGMVL